MPVNGRFERVRRVFHEHFGIYPKFFARSPGRVNLIGEHIDYSGYGVLPMAIGYDVVVAVSPMPSTSSSSSVAELHLANTDPKYGPRTVPANHEDIAIDPAEHSWTNYFLAGYKGLMESSYARTTRVTGSTAMLVDGQVPAGSGLSSSSALVCAAAVAAMHLAGVSVPPAELADLTALCERYTGVQGGGMDQAISIMGRPGSAMFIDFDPVTATPVPLPDSAVFVVANSSVPANKIVSQYNVRVLECRFAALVIAKAQAVLNWPQMTSLLKLQEALGLDLTAMAQLARTVLHPEPYTVAELETILEMRRESLMALYAKGNAAAAGLGALHLQARATHVFSEAERVFSFRDACSDASLSAGALLRRLGELMNASHESCDALYDCSCPELNTLTALARSSGALGSRLTGAGWGGCCVSLVPVECVDGFIAALKEGYFAKLFGGLAEVPANVLFPTAPAHGAAVLLCS